MIFCARFLFGLENKATPGDLPGVTLRGESEDYFHRGQPSTSILLPQRFQQTRLIASSAYSRRRFPQICSIITELDRNYPLGHTVEPCGASRFPIDGNKAELQASLESVPAAGKSGDFPQGCDKVFRILAMDTDFPSGSPAILADEKTLEGFRLFL